MRLPCRNLIALLHANGSIIDITAAFHPAYLARNSKQRFLGRSTELVVSTTTPLVMINPPPYYKKTGRRQKRRIGSSVCSKSGATYKMTLLLSSGELQDNMSAPCDFDGTEEEAFYSKDN